MPELPADPTPAQAVSAARLHALTSDEGFATRVRRANDRAVGHRDPARLYDALGEAHALAAVAMGEGAAPGPGEALDVFAGAFALGHGEPDTPRFRSGLLASLRTGGDPRLGLYWRLTRELRGDGGPPTTGAAHGWLIAGLARAVEGPGARG
ncbi:hypothetical protein JNUCC64_05295 [Streptomyces sp. JNUCC 64]